MKNTRASTYPFSMRLTPEDRERLTGEAKGMPLGTYLRAKLLGDSPLHLRRSGLPVEDRAALAKALALLGQSRISSNLNQLAYLANIGSLPFTPETIAELDDALVTIRQTRDLLLKALGHSAGGSS